MKLFLLRQSCLAPFESGWPSTCLGVYAINLFFHFELLFFYFAVKFSCFLRRTVILRYDVKTRGAQSMPSHFVETSIYDNIKWLILDGQPSTSSTCIERHRLLK